VTLLARILGYTDADAGFLWPSGYLELAARAGLTDGADAAPDGVISRASAAKLFRNLLTSDTKEGARFSDSIGKSADDVIIMDINATTADKKPGAIKTSAGVLMPRGSVVPEAFLGKRGTLITDADGRIVTFLPEGGNSATIVVGTVGATWVQDGSGRRYDIPGATPVYTSGETVTFTEIFVDIAPGAALTVFYSPGGAPDAVYMNNEPADEALVVSSAGASYKMFSPLTDGASDFSIYKHGAMAALSAIAQYDVATFDAVSRVLRVSDFRITGYYENAWPNTESPSRVTIMGKDFNVLPSAAETLSKFGLGQIVTLLFTADLTVAGAVERTQAQGTAIGIVGDGASGSQATVTLLDGMEFSGDPGISEYSASQLKGELVNVVSAGVGKITLIRIAARQGLKGEIDLSERTLGELKLSKSARVFERVGKGAVARISLDDIALPAGETIPAYKVAYAGTDNLGRVDTLILDDVTGDRYIYGFLSEKFEPAPTLGNEPAPTGTPAPMPAMNRYVAVKNSADETGPVLAGGLEFTNGALGGLALSGDGERAVAVAGLSEYKNVLRSDFTVADGKATVKLGGVRVPVSADVQCYNRASKKWFDTLADARAFSETLTVYCDRTPETGGKARVIIAG
jgi:hypothetical protein